VVGYVVLGFFLKKLAFQMVVKVYRNDSWCFRFVESFFWDSVPFDAPCLQHFAFFHLFVKKPVRA